MARPRVHDDALRDRLVAAAARTLTEEGSAALSLRRLATRCGTSTAAVYTLFGGKDELLEAVREAAVSSFSAAQHAIGTTDDPEADLRRLGHAYRDWALGHPDLYAVMFDAPPQGASPAGSWLEFEGIAPLVEAVRRVLPTSRAAELPAAVLSLWAGVHGYVALELGSCAGLPAKARETAFSRQLDILQAAWGSSSSAA
ncbi:MULTISPECIES: TetR/AcrR family transcriptional regulator [Kytococcus]|uniref:TetR family transcriptional regulator n=1 Tax=Kytococcus schroeteri TaxID=138300 RepID=A0A2I1PAX6_9MICO|nr:MULTISPECIES: TetR/AcrR family transcriptional regulator [Kytococcus]PKZ41760.1 TetR family transcriptional regulator [Kytococcus schroeteri]